MRSRFLFFPVLFLQPQADVTRPRLRGRDRRRDRPALVGPFRSRLYALYQAEALRQGLLVESVHGIQSLKSLAIEPLQRRVWDDRFAQSVAMRFRVEKISATAQSVTGLL